MSHWVAVALDQETSMFSEVLQENHRQYVILYLFIFTFEGVFSVFIHPPNNFTYSSQGLNSIREPESPRPPYLKGLPSTPQVSPKSDGRRNSSRETWSWHSQLCLINLNGKCSGGITIRCKPPYSQFKKASCHFEHLTLSSSVNKAIILVLNWLVSCNITTFYNSSCSKPMCW